MSFAGPAPEAAVQEFSRLSPITNKQSFGTVKGAFEFPMRSEGSGPFERGTRITRP